MNLSEKNTITEMAIFLAKNNLNYRIIKEKSGEMCLFFRLLDEKRTEVFVINFYETAWYINELIATNETDIELKRVCYDDLI